MAKNFIGKGNRMQYVVPAATAITAGDVVTVGDIHGIALQTYSTIARLDPTVSDQTVLHDTIALGIGGRWELAKATGAGSAIGQGVTVYWDATAKHVTSDDASGANKKIGRIFAPNTDTQATCDVLINLGV